MRIVYMGTPDFAVPPLEALHRAGHEILLVVSKPDTAKDRGKKIQSCPVKLKAEELGIPVETPEKLKNNEAFFEKLEALAPDFIVVAAYGKILPKRVLDTPKYACLNIHASLLPAYRGAAPIHRAVIDGVEETGVTLMFMAEGMDTGDICVQKTTPVGLKTTEELFDELSVMGAQLLVETLPAIADGTAPRIAQDEALATHAPMVFKEDGILDYTKSAREICCTVRGFYSWPMASTIYNGQVMKVHAAREGENVYDAAPGTVVKADKKGIVVACNGGSVVLERIQMPGKKAMDVSAFLAGNKIEIGTVLG